MKKKKEKWAAQVTSSIAVNENQTHSDGDKKNRQRKIQKISSSIWNFEIEYFESLKALSSEPGTKRFFYTATYLRERVL